jgi:type I restriction enzyme, S subunit
MTNSWQIKTLEEVCQFSNGLWKGETPPFVNVGVIRNTNFTKEGALDDSDIAYLDVEAKKFEKRRLRFGDIILEKSGGGPKQPVGRVALFNKMEGDFSFSNFTAALRVLDPRDLDFRFLHMFLYWTYLSGVTEGMQSHSTGIRNLDGGAYKAIKIAFPSLAEQRRIVDLLDEALAGIAVAKVDAEKNLKNARAIFESHLQSVFSERGPGWVVKRLEEVADANCSLSYGIVQPGEEYAEGMPVVRPTDLTTKVVSLSGLKRIDPKLADGYKRTKLHGGDLLLCVRGSTGVVSIAAPELVGANVTRGIVPIRFDRSLMMSEFGYYLFKSELIQTQIREKTYGAALMQINIRDLRIMSLSIPSLEEQAKITAKLEAIHNETEHLSSVYTCKIGALDELKKSLLHHAFAGSL